MSKPPSLTKIKADLREALGLIRLALHHRRNYRDVTVDCYGYTFTGDRQYHVVTKPGPAWKAYYTGRKEGEPIVAGTIDEIANQLWHRLRT